MDAVRRIREAARQGVRDFMIQHPGYSYFDPTIDHFNKIIELTEELKCSREGTHVDGCCFYVGEENG